MRRILLALVALGCISSVAEAAQRDQRSGHSARGAAQQAKPTQAQARPAAQATRSTQARPVAQTARTAPAQTARTAQAQPRRTTQAQPRRQQASNLRPGDVRTSSGGVLVRGASAATVSREAPARASTQSRRNAVATSCTRRNGRTVCGPARSSVAGWQAGLPVANFTQRECPDGTFATLARGHDDVVRCMPL